MFEELNVITQMFKGANVRRSLINPYGTTVLLESNGKNFVAQNLCTNYYSKSKGVTNTWDLFRVPVDEAEDIFHAMANFEWNTKIPQVQEMFKKAQPIADKIPEEVKNAGGYVLAMYIQTLPQHHSARWCLEKISAY